MKSQKIFEWACSIYILSLLIVLPFITWKDATYVIAIALLGYGLGKWKGKEYEARILPFAIAFLAAKPFLHYGLYPTDWSWQRYAILSETAVLVVIFLATRPRMAGSRPRTRAARQDPVHLFLAAIVFAIAGLASACAVPYILDRPITQQIVPVALAVSCLVVVYAVFARCSGYARN